MSELHRRASALFLDAGELPSAERRAFVEQRCAGNEELLQEVLSLLEHADETDEFLESPALGAEFSIPRAASEEVLPGAIGPYRPLERLGAGGFGVVYLAEQTEPVKRRVALKLIKPGMDSEEVVARFAAEREALERMDHPGVASVLDAGVTEEGRPYFVMEYVPGDPITAFCDRARLDVNARLELFARVCEAVQHAHQKGIIHRDLKPSNILVRLVDGAPAPKVIDFGVAKALAEPLGDGKLHTMRGHLIGTPEYMSPEQAESSGIDVDTRTDIYSLGVVLYELLCGSLPIDPHSSGSGSRNDLVRAVREEQPPAPSKRVAKQCDARVAECRGTTAERLMRELTGDLDWITLMALEKERLRRYASASELAADLARYGSKEPVSAGPPSASYRLSKFVARNRLAVFAAGTILLALCLGTVGVALAMFEAGQERDRALEAERLAASRLQDVVDAMARAEAEAQQASAVTSFLKAMWTFAQPEGGEEREISAVQLLDEASRMLDTSLEHDPAVQVSLRSTLGSINTALSRHREAEREMRAALLIGRTLEDLDEERLATLLHNLAQTLASQAEWQDAKPLLDESLALRLEHLPADDIELAASYDLLARYHRNRGEVAQAVQASRRAMAIEVAVHGPERAASSVVAHNLGVFLGDSGELEQAQEILLRCYELRSAARGEDHTQSMVVLASLAQVWHGLRLHAEAAQAFAKLLAARERVYGPESLLTAQSRNDLATQYVLLGRASDAIPMLRQALRNFERDLSERHPITISATNNLAKCLVDDGKPEEALEYAQRAVSLCKAHVAAKHVLTGFSLSVLGEILLELERFAEARDALHEAYPIIVAARGANSSACGPTLRRLARAHAGLGEKSEAAQWTQQADELEGE